MIKITIKLPGYETVFENQVYSKDFVVGKDTNVKSLVLFKR